MKPGDLEFRARVRSCDHLAVLEGWCGWSVLGRRWGVDVFEVGPFASKAAAVAWLRSWLGNQRRPLHSNSPGSWHWSAT